METRKSGTNAGRDPKGRFARGNRGKPKGTRHRTTQAVEALLDGEAQALTRKAVELALEGDTTALRLCLERIAPPRREAAVAVDIPVIETAGDLPKAIASLLAAAGRGDLTPGEAGRLAALVGEAGKALETRDIEERLRRLEEQHTRKRW
jgi:hypothetical protein